MKCENEKCGKEHDGSFGSGRFCCRSCANSRGARSYETKKKVSETLSGGKPYIPREVYTHCLNCGKKLLDNYRKKYCNHQCQWEYTYKQYIERWKQGLEKGSNDNEYLSRHIRRYMFEIYDNECQECGWSRTNIHTGNIPLTVHHIDGNCKNNKEENLELLCPNCHSLTDNYGSRNINCLREGRKNWRNTQA